MNKQMVAAGNAIDGESGVLERTYYLSAINRRQTGIHADTVTLRTVGRASAEISIPCSSRYETTS
jgi:hypothetical protein